MPIISVRDNENNRWKRNALDETKKKNKGCGSYSERVRGKWFCWALSPAFSKERELYESKHVA